MKARTHKWEKIDSLLKEYQKDRAHYQSIAVEIAEWAKRMQRDDLRELTNLGATVAHTADKRLATAFRPDAAAALSDVIRREAYVRAAYRAMYGGRMKYTKPQYRQLVEKLIEDALTDAFKRMRSGKI